MKLSRNHLQFLILIFLNWLLFWNASWESRPRMDAMTYGALSKTILKTGDWMFLHYSQQAYANFFQHPPLVMWLNAILFHWVGANDITIKILPTFFGMLCVAGVFLWGQQWKSSWFGFIASIILLSSTRFIKYSSTLMLDPFLTTFMLWSLLFAKYSTIKSKKFSILSGICFSAAFLSKGLPAFAILPGMIFLYRRNLNLWNAFIFGSILVLSPWLFWGQGFKYLECYLHESIQGRFLARSIQDHFGVFHNLIKVYWPWLPFFLWGWIRLAQQGRQIFRSPLFVPGLTALAIIGGFTLSGHFLEHYLVPFYPFAALIAAEPLANLLEHYQENLLKGLFWSLLCLALLMTGVPLHWHGDAYKDPIRKILAQAVQTCHPTSSIHRLQISTEIAELWYATALGLWYTPWDVFSAPATQNPQDTASELLLGTTLESKNPHWIPTSISEGALRIYQTQKTQPCPRLQF